MFVLNSTEAPSVAFLEEKIAEYLNTDDVFHTDFLKGIIFQGANESQVKTAINTTEISKKWGTEWIYLQPNTANSHPLSQGPYAIQNGEISQVWRLYDDEQSAFLQSVWPALDGSGSVL